jgi:flagellin-specific chaperone FliS
MEFSDNPARLLIPYLDKVLEILEAMKISFEQTKIPGSVDDYYNVVMSLERAKEIKTRLEAIIQSQQGRKGQSSWMDDLRKKGVE